MLWRGLGIASVVVAGLGIAGCLKFETDLQALLEENNTLSEELAEARQENEILTRALDDIKREQEALQLLLNAGKSNLNAGRVGLPQTALAAGGAEAPGGDDDEWQTPQTLDASPAATASPADMASPAAIASPAPPAPAVALPRPPAAAPPVPSTRSYVTKPGDVLSHIARANNTTVNRLLELNPNLRNRRNHVIYENERLRLP